MRKKLFFTCTLLAFSYFGISQKTQVSAPESRVHSICLGVSGGAVIPFSFLAKTQATGGFGQADFFAFMTQNITLGANYAYNYFPGKNDYVAVPIHEVLIYGNLFFKPAWNPYVSFGLGYYGEPHVGRFGFVPGIGIMPKLTKNIFFQAKMQAVFFDADGHFFKLGAGFVFRIYQNTSSRK